MTASCGPGSTNLGIDLDSEKRFSSVASLHVWQSISWSCYWRRDTSSRGIKVLICSELANAATNCPAQLITWPEGSWLPGPYYPLGTTGTVPRAYDIFRHTKGEQIKTKKRKKNGEFNTKFKLKKKNIFFFSKTKIPPQAYLWSGKCVRRAHFSDCVWLKERSVYKIWSLDYPCFSIISASPHPPLDRIIEITLSFQQYFLSAYGLRTP
jgi:hypothetical protein